MNSQNTIVMYINHGHHSPMNNDDIVLMTDGKIITITISIMNINDE